MQEQRHDKQHSAFERNAEKSSFSCPCPPCRSSLMKFFCPLLAIQGRKLGKNLAGNLRAHKKRAQAFCEIFRANLIRTCGPQNKLFMPPSFCASAAPTFSAKAYSVKACRCSVLATIGWAEHFEPLVLAMSQARKTLKAFAFLGNASLITKLLFTIFAPDNAPPPNQQSDGLPLEFLLKDPNTIANTQPKLRTNPPKIANKRAFLISGAGSPLTYLGSAWLWGLEVSSWPAILRLPTVLVSHAGRVTMPES